jgi:hypothetical protein
VRKKISGPRELASTNLDYPYQKQPPGRPDGSGNNYRSGTCVLEIKRSNIILRSAIVYYANGI